ncbi:MAG: DUF3566 domain-containing protein [Acidimicrobiales bacterium]|nr:DUF3566 domain-containing protein [Acidimicrobiales bacterium]
MAPHRLTLRSVNVRSVVRVSVVLYACMVLVGVVAWAILWVVAGALGVTANVEDFIAELLTLDRFHVSVLVQALATLVGAPVVIALGSLANALAAIFYNQIIEVVDGIQIDVDLDE